MIYHSTQSDHYLSYLILRGKQKKTTEYAVPPNFQCSEEKFSKRCLNTAHKNVLDAISRKQHNEFDFLEIKLFIK